MVEAHGVVGSIPALSVDLGSYSVGVAVQTVNLLASASSGSTPLFPIWRC